MNEQTVKIPASKIVPGDNDRKVFDPVKLAELAESYRSGLYVPAPLVRPVGDVFQLVAGERRTRAMRDILGWAEIPCVVQELSDEDASKIMLAENTNRVDLDPIEEALAYQNRITRFGWTEAEVARIAGRKVARVREVLPLLKLAFDVQHFVKTGDLPIRYAALMGDLDQNRQRIVLGIYNDPKTSVTLIRWREIIAHYLEEQAAESQMDMFGMELRMQEYAENAIAHASKGKRARTGAKAARQLPKVRVASSDTMAPIFDRYILDLKRCGQDDAAGAVGNIYNLLVAKGWITIPESLELPKLTNAGVVADELHVQEI